MAFFVGFVTLGGQRSASARVKKEKGRKQIDAQRSMLRFSSIALLCGLTCCLSAPPMKDTVDQHSTHEVLLKSSAPVRSPFELWCTARVEGPATSHHAKMNITLFYAGNDIWKLRFTPDVAGLWQWQVGNEGAKIGRARISNGPAGKFGR